MISIPLLQQTIDNDSKVLVKAQIIRNADGLDVDLFLSAVSLQQNHLESS